MGHQPRAVLAGLALLTAAGGTVFPAAQAADRPGATATATHSSTLWPTSMCASQKSARFTTASEGSAGDFAADKAPGKGRLSAAHAYRNFKKLVGRSRVPRSHSQTRFGIITDNVEGNVSANPIEEVPMLRRKPAWLVTNCHDRQGPPGSRRGAGRNGKLYFIVADTAAPKTLGWFYSYVDHHGFRHNYAGGGNAQGDPRPASTHYYSTHWHLVARAATHRRLLLRYKRRNCYALDHVNVDGGRSARITVILSTDTHQKCASDLASAPYTEAFAGSSRFGQLRHGRTGPLRFQPQPS